jgi:hypothetical protein
MNGRPFVHLLLLNIAATIAAAILIANIKPLKRLMDKEWL